MELFRVETRKRTHFVNIDRQVQDIVDKSGTREGIVHVFVPHTTAAVTINENADPDVPADMDVILDRMVPWNGDYAHAEGNSAAHVKSSLVGCHQEVFIRDGRLALGTWQSLFFCEFDGPRTRNVWVRVVPFD